MKPRNKPIPEGSKDGSMKFRRLNSTTVECKMSITKKNGHAVYWTVSGPSFPFVAEVMNDIMDTYKMRGL